MLYCGPCGPSGSQDIKMILVNNCCDHFISVSTYSMIWLLKLLHIFYPTELTRESIRHFWIFHITSRFFSLDPRWPLYFCKDKSLLPNLFNIFVSKQNLLLITMLDSWIPTMTMSRTLNYISPSPSPVVPLLPFLCLTLWCQQ